MHSRNFQGQWITNALFRDAEPIHVFHRQLDKVELPETPQNQHILFRKTFELDRPKQATVFITADDFYKLYVNGAYVTEGPCPGYPFHYYYNEVDVTPYLREGRNCIAVHTYYQGLINRVWVSGDMRHGLLLDLVCDGRTILQSDGTFRCRTHGGFGAMGIVGYKTQYMERYDSNAPEVGFEEIGFDDSAWVPAAPRLHADYALFAQPTRQLDMEPIRPAEIVPFPGGLRVDFGAMYVGNLEARACGPKGATVQIRCGQELNADGSVRFELRANCRYEEEWVLSGAGDALRQYDYKSFRYAEFWVPEGCALQADSIRLIARHYPFECKAACDTQDPDLRKVWDLCVRSLQYGVQETIQDCMEREKGHYLGDGCYSALAHALATRDVGIMEKLIEETLRSAFVNKGLMTCAACSMMQEIAEYPLMLPLLVRAHYHLSKDRDALERWYGPIAEMLDFYRDSYENEEGLLMDLDKWSVVEWPAPARDGYDFDLTEGRVNPGTHNAINAYYIGAIKVVNSLARLLGKPAYRDPKKLYETFVRTFYDPKAKLFRDAPESAHISIPGNAVVFMYGLCPDRETEANIVSMIREKRLSASMFYMTYAMLFGLRRIGEKALCLELLKDPGGWLRMLREGATTTFEGWGKDSKWNTSLFHLTFTYPIVFLTDWGMEAIMDF
ncbi:MAG TPA: family 78 glycoside hydrolase catalytic domain [Clostridia bacterium]|nr:family 78 glycoside hydrolase catalytic domain [Clostridia bacterium]